MKITLKKFTSLLLFGFLLTSFIATSQDNYMKDKMKNKVKSQRVAFITQQLDLSEVEAQKFWPIYNGYQADMKQIKSSMDFNRGNELTDKESEDLLYSMLDMKSKEIELQKKYIQKLKTAIPAKKIVMLFKTERDFKEKVVSNIRERRKNNFDN
ncbi:MAG: sensor of ECF-type sigma factor [Saprospiraceae bacterium]|jgi:hypothetical protein|nr:sensor of ECF-type sigma factor [Saprospiraceae bacterium]MBL0024692.1 sensor of ECF-type sigma factor [Saprospiraceae bacterium]